MTDLIDTKGRRLLYVAACGRSGTTILGYLLGNAKGALDLGEVNEWLRFDGRPNGFGPGTENYAFWDKVMTLFVGYYGRPDFARLRQLQRQVDYHWAMLGQVTSGYRFRQRQCAEFRVFLRSLYQAIFDASDAEMLVDSSKYPSRLWHLAQVMPRENLGVLHLRREASAVIRAMQTAEQGKPRSRLAAASYYYGIEFLVARVLDKVRPSRLSTVEYEALMRQPQTILRAIGEELGLNVDVVIDQVQNDLPLSRGYIFNGNRMRMREQVVFRKPTGPTASP